MPATVKVRVLEARNLPIMDKSAETTDAFVEVRLNQVCFKTDVCAKTLNPKWETQDAFVFEVDDEELLDDILQFKQANALKYFKGALTINEAYFRIMDYDTYSANDPIGKVNIELSHMFDMAVVYNTNTCNSKYSCISGWLPILDTLNGARGELEVSISMEVKLTHPMPASVQVYSSPIAPPNSTLSSVFGFINELLTCIDPEMQWIDKIRTPRATNEARQAVLRRLSIDASRKIIKRASNLGANAILGYRTMYDVEGESTKSLSIRVCGTAVILTPSLEDTSLIVRPAAIAKVNSYYENTGENLLGNEFSENSYSNNSVCKQRFLSADHTPARLSSLDNSGTYLDLLTKDDSWGKGIMMFSPQTPFLTCTRLSTDCHLGTSGVVVARSVKCLDDIYVKENADLAEYRKAWWQELRSEILSQMQKQACNAVIGYREDMTIFSGVVLLSAVGTAVQVDRRLWSCPFPGMDQQPVLSDDSTDLDPQQCSPCHSPATVHGGRSCSGLNCTASVSPILLTTCEFDSCLYEGTSKFVKSTVLRKLPEKMDSNEEFAKEICALLPSMERELYDGLVLDMQRVNRNSVIAVRSTIHMSDSLIVGLMIGTAVDLTPLKDCSEESKKSAPILLENHEPFRKASTCILSKHVGRQSLIVKIWRGSLEETRSLLHAKSKLSKTVEHMIISSQYRFRKPNDGTIERPNWAPPLDNILLSIDLLEENTSIQDSPSNTTCAQVQVALCAMVHHGNHSSQNEDDVILSSVPLGSLPNPEAYFYIGRLDWCFIRETVNLKDILSIDVFLTLAAQEMFWAIKAHIRSMSGNIVTCMAFSLTDFSSEGPSTSGKNQAQCLLAVTGDIYKKR